MFALTALKFGTTPKIRFVCWPCESSVDCVAPTDAGDAAGAWGSGVFVSGGFGGGAGAHCGCWS